MSTPSVQVETRGSVALVTLNRPDSANTLNLEVAMDLLAAAMTCGRNPAVRAVVLTGSGRQFCFGGDLRAMAARGGAADAYLRELTGYLHSAISHFVRMDAPVIAAVNGTAAGAGGWVLGVGGPGGGGPELQVQPCLHGRRTNSRCGNLVPVAADDRREAVHGVAAAQPRAHCQ